MSSTIERLSGEPIMVVKHHGYLRAENLETFRVTAAQIAAEATVPLIWIIDVSDTETDFAQIMKMVIHESRGEAGTASNAPGRVILVGSHQLTRLFQNAMSQPQFGGLDIPMLPSLNDALAVARLRVQNQNAHP